MNHDIPPLLVMTSGANRVFPRECELLGSWTFSNLRPKRGSD